MLFETTSVVNDSATEFAEDTLIQNHPENGIVLRGGEPGRPRKLLGPCSAGRMDDDFYSP